MHYSESVTIYVSLDLRGKSRVILGTQVVRVQIEHANHEGQEDHNEDDHELEDVLHSATQGDL